MGFSVEPSRIEISDIPNLSSQISTIDAANDNVLLELETKGAVVPETYKQHTLDLFKHMFIANSLTELAALYSTDGITWTSSTLPAQNSKIAYGNGKVVAISGVNPYFSYSTDGINWTASSNPYSTYTLSYGNDKFVSIGDSKAFYSSDGINWIQFTRPITSQQITLLVYGGGKFVAISGSNNVAIYSTDGITWTQTTMPSSQYWSSVTYGNGKFVAVTQSQSAAYSTDGITWTASTMPENRNWKSVTYGNEKFVAISGGNPSDIAVSAHSTDGITWTQYNISIPNGFERQLQSVTYGNGKFVAVAIYSTNILYSTDGISWTQSSIPYGYWSRVTYGQITTTKTIAEILGVN